MSASGDVKTCNAAVEAGSGLDEEHANRNWDVESQQNKRVLVHVCIKESVENNKNKLNNKNKYKA